MVRIHFANGVIYARTSNGSSPEHDWGHGPYREQPDLPGWLARMSLATRKTKYNTTAVLDPVKFFQAVGYACCGPVGKAVQQNLFATMKSYDIEFADTFAWPDGVRRELVEID